MNPPIPPFLAAMLGVGVTLLGHVLAVSLGLGLYSVCATVSPQLGDTVGGALLVAAVAPGLTQVLWVAPAVWYFLHRRSSAGALAVGATAAIVLLLNTACFGIVSSGIH